MAVKASVTITISKYRDTDNITRYYKLQASTASKPAKPTTLTPSGWTNTEPTYTSGSTNTLYIVDRYVFSDGTFQYTDVSKSTSYEAAKEAYNKAQAAQDDINNLEIGGRNRYIIKNSLEGYIQSNGVIPLGTMNTVYQEHTSEFIEVSQGEEWIFQVWVTPVKSNSDYLWMAYQLYNSDKTPNGSRIVKTQGTNTGLPQYGFYHITIPQNVKYLRVSARMYTDGKIKLEKGNKSTDWTPAPEDTEEQINYIQDNYLEETKFTEFTNKQVTTNQSINTRLTNTEVTVYGNPENPDDPNSLVNRLRKVDNDVNGDDGALNRIATAEDTLEGTGLNDYDQQVKITQRFLNVETDVEQIKNVFKITGGTNLVQNSVGYFADNDNKPTMWTIENNTIYKPFGYDADLVGATISRGKLFCAKGRITTTPNNIVALLSHKMMSVSFKYKNGANAISKIKIFNGSVTYFEKTINTTVNQWTEYTFNPDTDPILANNSFLCTSNSLQISIESTNSSNNNGIEISDLMLNYGDVKPWELASNEVYGAMVRLSSLGIEVTATAANTKNFMTTDGILVFKYDKDNDTIIGEPITKITDDGTLTNKLESTGDISERNLVNTMIKDSSNNDGYVEYIR